MRCVIYHINLYIGDSGATKQTKHLRQYKVKLKKNNKVTTKIKTITKQLFIQQWNNRKKVIGVSPRNSEAKKKKDIKNKVARQTTLIYIIASKKNHRCLIKNDITEEEEKIQEIFILLFIQKKNFYVCSN